MTYTINADGTDAKPFFSDGQSQDPRWSPDGSQIHIFCCDDGMAAHVIDVDGGDLHTFPPPDSTLETNCGGSWSPDGERLTCESYGIGDAGRNGIYSVRVSDGQGLARITSNPGGEDHPGDYSPDGTRMVFARIESEGPTGLFVTNVDGTGLHKVSGPNPFYDLSPGRWSPTGDTILFAGRITPDDHKAIWMVNADGSGLHQLPLPLPCGGPFADPTAVGCYNADWSPDGSMIVFVQSTPDGQQENLYLANADGTGVIRLTDTGGDDEPDWGLPSTG